MQLSVTGRHVEVTAEIKEYAFEKASKLPRFFDRVQTIDVVLDHDAGNFTAEVIVKVDRAEPFVAHDSGPDIFALIDTLTDNMSRQLRRHKEKRRDHHRHKTSKGEFTEPE